MAKLNASINAINACVYQSIYREHFHAPLFHSASAVSEIAQKYMAKMFPQEGEGQDLAAWEVSHIQNAYTKFETILISELQSISSYIVTRKAGFDIAAMVEAGKVFLLNGP